MIEQQSAMDLIRRRRSCRAYMLRAIEPDKLKALQDTIDQISSMPIGPYTAAVQSRFVIVDTGFSEEAHAIKVGTYGAIAGARYYLVGILSKTEQRVAAFGYQFEQIILSATALGLGTCWLGGTFNRTAFTTRIQLTEDEFTPIISPIGYERGRPHLIGSLIRSMAGSDQRKPWSELFFDQSLSTPLTHEHADNYQPVLEMVRLAPSASNKQPWRIVRQADRFDFYLQRTVGYTFPGFDIQKNDAGIAMCHFEMTARELDLKGRWGNLSKPPLVTGTNGLEYIASWLCASEIT